MEAHREEASIWGHSRVDNIGKLLEKHGQELCVPHELAWLSTLLSETMWNKSTIHTWLVRHIGHKVVVTFLQF